MNLLNENRSEQGNETFYQDLPIFNKFKELSHSGHYQSIPNDWWVIMSDVVGSTQAFLEGRYRDVNLIGASSIAAIGNVIKDLEIPFVFGGDGTSMVVPASLKDIVLAELSGLVRMSEAQFQLNLRIGCLEVSELLNQGVQLKVAKFGLLPKRSLAVFQGGGLSLADKLIKKYPEKYLYKTENVVAPDLSALSCRWKPIPAKKGKVLSLIVQAKNDDTNATYFRVVDEIQKIIGGDLTKANPVHFKSMKYKSLKKVFTEESRTHEFNWTYKYLIYIMNILMIQMVFSFRFHKIIGFLKKYLNDMETHSDYRKFDDSLRLVLDLKEVELTKLIRFLKKEFQDGNIFYGAHISNEAIMTCVFQGMDEGEHIHFIDGGDGGYTMASRELKSQIQKGGVID